MNHQNLWAPWRISYIKGLTRGCAAPAEQPDAGDQTTCFLCDAARADLDDAQRAERLVLHRNDHGILLLNRYPYTNGHLMAAPLAHLPDLGDMTAAQRGALMELAALGDRLLKATMNPHGLNVGMNVGRCAGAGVPGHIHLHVVPRWNGDVNFMDSVAGVRVIPEALEESFKELKDALERGV